MNTKIIKLISCLIPQTEIRKKFRNKYIIKNILNEQHLICFKEYNKTLQKLKIESKNRKLNVCFYVSETTKWNLQTIYDAMKNSNIFKPFVVVSTRPKYYTKTAYEHNLAFFKNCCDDVRIGFDVQNEEAIDLKSFNPDIIFYQQPWDLCSFKNQTIQYVKDFALTCYCPYPISEAPETLITNIKWFHSRLWKHFIFNNEIEKQYTTNFGYTSKHHNLVITGHPKLDIYENKNTKSNYNNYVIYSPHHAYSFSPHKYATWGWNGYFMLWYAKKHPEINWVFKPHPDFKLATWYNEKLTTKEQIEDYCEEWKRIGLYYDDGNYFDLFNKSKCLITDCGSWLTEYLPTQNPVIHLRSKIATGYSDTNNKIMPFYYQAWDLEQLKEHLDNVLINNKDPLKADRIRLISELGLDKFNATDNIINEIKREIYT